VSTFAKTYLSISLVLLGTSIVLWLSNYTTFSIDAQIIALVVLSGSFLVRLIRNIINKNSTEVKVYIIMSILLLANSVFQMLQLLAERTHLLRHFHG
jgi:hypothetical protein